MANPFKLCSEKVLISTPEYDWEKSGGDGINLPYVNEGPAILENNSNVYLIYSASGCWCEDYCLGLLKLVGNNPLSKKSWQKYNKPIFSSSKEIIGPGHCSFITKMNKNNIEQYMFFHSFNDRDNLLLTNVSARYIEIDNKDLSIN